MRTYCDYEDDETELFIQKRCARKFPEGSLVTVGRHIALKIRLPEYPPAEGWIEQRIKCHREYNKKMREQHKQQTKKT